MSKLARFAMVFGLAFSAPAMATTLARLSVDQMTDAADFVVRGTVEEVWSEMDARGTIWTRARIDVETSLKNEAPAELVVEAPGGQYDGEVQEVDLAPRYSVGEEVLLFVSEKGDSGRYGTVAMYGGKYTVRQNPADGSEMAVRFTVSYTRPYDARFIPNPPADQRLGIDVLERQIRARAALGWDGQSIPGASAEHLRTINKLQPGVK
jgi:hypothetical protein